MAEHRHNHSSHRRADAQIRRGTWKHEPPQSNPWPTIIGLLVAAGVAAGVVAGDARWSWRDSLRRLAHGEEIPAFRANEWADARSVQGDVAEEVQEAASAPAPEDKDTRRALALHTLLSAAGEETISGGGAEMWGLMEEFCLDVDWLEEMVSFCPMEYAETALPILAHIYRAEKKKMDGMPANRRFASAVAFEFARAGMSREQALDSYLFYAASGQKHWLNNRFSELALWQMRVIAARLTDTAWSGETTLAWFQRNSSLPSRGYVTLGDLLGRQECSLFGASVNSPTFGVLYLDAAEEGAASVYEASGCSTARDRALYSATAACANGVPALVAGNEHETICLVDVNGSWETSAPLAEDMVCSWSFCGQNHPDFVQLAARLGAEMEKSLASFRLLHMGQFHQKAGNAAQALACFREAVKVQPLNYAAWVACHACGASGEELAAAQKHVESLPGVAAALRSLGGK